MGENCIQHQVVSSARGKGEDMKEKGKEESTRRSNSSDSSSFNFKIPCQAGRQRTATTVHCNCLTCLTLSGKKMAK